MSLLTAQVWITQSLITGLCRIIKWPVMSPPEQRQGVNQLLCTLSRRSASLPDQPLSTSICPCLSCRVAARHSLIQVQYATDPEHLRLTTLGEAKFSASACVCVCICECVHTTLAHRLLIQSWCWCSSNRVAGRLHKGYAAKVLELSCVRRQQSRRILDVYTLKSQGRKSICHVTSFSFSVCLHLFFTLLNTKFRNFIHKQIWT